PGPELREVVPAAATKFGHGWSKAPVPFQQLEPPAVTSRTETLTLSTPAPESAAVPVSVPGQPDALYAPAAGDETVPLGAAASFSSEKLVVELTLPARSCVSTSTDP